MSDIALHLPGEIIMAGGCRSQLPSVAERLGMRRPLVITDPHMASQSPVHEVLERLEATGIAAELYAGVQPDPSTTIVEDAMVVLREHDADGVIAIGGGSSLDTGKAVAVMARNRGHIRDYEGYHRIPEPGLPLIGIPTTAGTGSEVTRVTVITDDRRSLKMMLLDDQLLCTAALVDHELTHSCPPSLTAHVGIDSLTHAIEAHVSRRANPVTDLWALKAVELIAPNVRRACASPEDVGAREALAVGATLAGMAFSNASVALVHGMSRPIGANFHLAHGLSNAVLLPAVTRFSIEAAPERYATVARTAGVASSADDTTTAGRRLVDELEALNADLGIGGLGTLNVDRRQFDAVKHAMADAALASGSPGFNPRVPTAEEIVALYDEVY